MMRRNLNGLVFFCVLLWCAQAVAQPAEIIPVGYGFVNAYVLRIGQKAVLVDAGQVGHEPQIERNMRKRGIDPSKLSALILTHGHSDHAGGVAWFRERYKLPVWLQQSDSLLVIRGQDDPLLIATPRKGLARMVRKRVDSHFPAFRPDSLFRDSVSLHSLGLPGVYTMHTPGHTAGSVSIVAGKEVIAGDVVRGSILPGFRRRPQLHFFASDQQALSATWQKLLQQPFDYWYVGHGGPLRPDRIKKLLRRNRRFLSKEATNVRLLSV